MVAPIIDMRCGKHSGVSGIPTQLLVLHSGETPLRGGYAQAITDWGDTPLEQGGPEASWQWFVDPIAIVNMIDVEYTAWHATWANPLSEAFEQAGYARFSFEEWTTAEGLKQMDNLAWLLAQRCKATGIPARWLTTAEVNAVKAGDRSIKGLCTHAQIDPAQRTDPGNNYPYDMLMAKIHGYMGGSTEGDDDMPSAKEIVDELLSRNVNRAGPDQSGTTNLHAIMEWFDANMAAVAESAANKVLNKGVEWYGFDGKIPKDGRRHTSLATDLAWADTHRAAVSLALTAVNAKIDALAKLASSPGGATKDEVLAQLDASVKASFAEYKPTFVKEG